MTQPNFDEVAGNLCYYGHDYPTPCCPTCQPIADALRKAVEDEREACAKVAIEVGNYHDDVYGPSAGEYIATAIRQMDGGK